MSKIDKVITVNMDREPFLGLPLIIGFDHDRFLARLLELGHDYFNSNRTYALLLDTTPVDLIISEMKDYKEIREAFPNDRVYGKALYIGNYRKEDWISIAEQVASGWGHKIIEVIE